MPAEPLCDSEVRGDALPSRPFNDHGEGLDLPAPAARPVIAFLHVRDVDVSKASPSVPGVLQDAKATGDASVSRRRSASLGAAACLVALMVVGTSARFNSASVAGSSWSYEPTDIADWVADPLPSEAPVPADPSVDVSTWMASPMDDDDGPNDGKVETGNAPPGAETIALINYHGSLPWQIAHSVSNTSYVWGYATKPSYLPGEVIDLKVSTTAPTFEASLWRYSTTGATKDQPFAFVATQAGFRGTVGAARTIGKTTHMIKTAWLVAAHLTIPTSAPSGVYLVRLAGSTNVQSYVPITVRSAKPATYLYVVPSMTWQAYNVWGGTSLYQSIGIPSAMPHDGARARSVSYDRPYLYGDGFPMFQAEDMTIIKFLQQNGYEVAFTTDTDLSIDPAHQWNPKAVIIGGHSEYWTTKMYDWLNTKVNIKGTFGLASFGANSGFWTCTMLAAGRTERCLRRGITKKSAGIDNLRSRKRPEQAIFGAEFGVIAVGGGQIKVSKGAVGTGLLNGTGLVSGSSLGYLAGYEVDQVHPTNQSFKKGKYDLKFATMTVRQQFNPCACPYNRSPLRGDTMVRRLPSGRRVFAAGTLWWGYGLDTGFASKYGVPSGFPRLMKNILAYVVH